MLADNGGVTRYGGEVNLADVFFRCEDAGIIKHSHPVGLYILEDRRRLDNNRKVIVTRNQKYVAHGKVFDVKPQKGDCVLLLANDGISDDGSRVLVTYGAGTFKIVDGALYDTFPRDGVLLRRNGKTQSVVLGEDAYNKFIWAPFDYQLRILDDALKIIGVPV